MKVIYPCPKKDEEYEKNATEYCKKYKIDRKSYQTHKIIHDGISEKTILWAINTFRKGVKLGEVDSQQGG